MKLCMIILLVPLFVQGATKKKLTLVKVDDSETNKIRRGISLSNFGSDLAGKIGSSLSSFKSPKGSQVFGYDGVSDVGGGGVVSLGHGFGHDLGHGFGGGVVLGSSGVGHNDFSVLKSGGGFSDGIGFGHDDLTGLHSVGGLGGVSSLDFGGHDDISLLKSSAGLGGFSSSGVVSTFGSGLGLGSSIGHGLGGGGFSSGVVGSKLSSGIHPHVFAPCTKGLLRNAYGRCVVPKVSNNLFVFNSPQRKVKVLPPPKVPTPKVHVNYVFVKSPDQALGPKPIVVPPPQEKTNIYVLSKRPVVKQDVIQVQSPPVDPEVFFVQYNDGQNQVLPGGVDLQSVLLHSKAAEQKVGGAAIIADTLGGSAHFGGALDGLGAGIKSVGGSLGGVAVSGGDFISGGLGAGVKSVGGSLGGVAVSGGDFITGVGDLGGQGVDFKLASAGSLGGQAVDFKLASAGDLGALSGGGVQVAFDSGHGLSGAVVDSLHGFGGRIGAASGGLSGSHLAGDLHEGEGVAIFAKSGGGDGFNSVVSLQPEVGPLVLDEKTGTQLIDGQGAEILHSSFSAPEAVVASPTKEEGSPSVVTVLTADEVKQITNEQVQKSH